MGEVVLAHDLDIGRKVAVKRLRGDIDSKTLEARFYREARIQALLDHPAILPVHELGRDAAGRPYFTMKRLTGTTLAEVIKTGCESQQRMLRAFAEVCLAIEFAHARGFIHRDLKPSNVMLGEYGEVYVIDWGLARHHATGVAVAGDETDPDMLSSGGSLGGETQVGTVMGTPGYMSPEQIRGESVGPATDVYALGAILFEILTRRNLHPRGEAAIQSTLLGGVLSPAANAPDRAIPPELDALCTDALAETTAARPSARVLADRVQRYLDGDRDLEQRRALATELITSAQQDLDSGDPARRGSALKAAGRALALDQGSEPAAALVVRLMLEPPPVMPPELAKRLADVDQQQVSKQGTRAGMALLSYFVFLPIVVWMGIRDWRAVAGLYGLVCVASACSMITARYRHHGFILVALVVNASLFVALGRLTSPLLVVPALVVASAVLFGMFPQLQHRPVLVLGVNVLALLLPLALEAIGVWSPTWHLEGGHFVVAPSALDYDGTAARVFLIGVTVATVVLVSLIVRSLAMAQRDGRRQLEMQAWHLEHLIPSP